MVLANGQRPSGMNGFAGDSAKDNGSKAKFFGSIQVYLEDLLRVLVH